MDNCRRRTALVRYNPLYSPELAALSLPLLRRSSNAVVVGILVTLLLMIGTRTLLVLHPRARWRRRLLCLMLPLAVATVLHHRVVRALLLLRRLLVKCPGLLLRLLLVAKVMARLVHRSSTLTIRSYCFSTLTVQIIINRTRQRLLDDLPLKASLGRVPNVSRSNNVWVLYCHGDVVNSFLVRCWLVRVRLCVRLCLVCRIVLLHKVLLLLHLLLLLLLRASSKTYTYTYTRNTSSYGTWSTLAFTPLSSQVIVHTVHR